MISIKNYDFYNDEMKKGLEDKLFFLKNNEIRKNVDTILDYGCANGALLNQISVLNKNMKFIGYDMDENMIRLAKEINEQNNNTYFYHDFKKAKFRALIESKKSTAFLCSSIIHEIYSYGNEKSIENFWEQINFGDHEYIIIRDMSLSEGDIFYQNLDNEILDKVLHYGNKQQIKDYNEVWGDFRSNKDLIHYLFKYRYIDNWKREVEENYFPLSTEELLKKLNLDNFEIIYDRRYLLDFQKEVIKKDFNIDLFQPTHLNLILKRKKLTINRF